MSEILPVQLNEKLMELCHALESAVADYEDAAREFALHEDEYRHQKAVSFLSIVTVDGPRPKKERRTIPAIEATRDIECREERQQAYIARANKEAAKERVLSIRAQLSAVQSVAASVRAELELARTGSQYET